MTNTIRPIVSKSLCALLGSIAFASVSATANAGALDLFQSDYSLLFTPNNAFEVGGMYAAPERTRKNSKRNNMFGLGISRSDGGDDGDFAQNFFIPSLSLKYSLTDDLGCMGSIRYPYGTHQDSGKTWAGRYFAVETDMTNISYNLDCIYSFDAGDTRIGLIGGIRRETSETTLSQMLSAAAVASAAEKPLLAIKYAGKALFDPNSASSLDSLTTLKGKSAEFGYTLGVSVDVPNHGFKAHAIYQSEIKHHYDGRQTIDVASGIQGDIGASQLSTTGTTKLVTSPESFQLNMSKQLENGWGIVGFLRWVNWSRVQSLDVLYDNGGASKTQLKWKDGWTYGAGVTKLISPELVVYGVLSYDKDVADDITRGARSGSFDSIGATLGATVALTDNTYLKLSGTYKRAFSNKILGSEPTQVDGDSDPVAGVLYSESDDSDVLIGKAIIGFVF